MYGYTAVMQDTLIIDSATDSSTQAQTNRQEDVYVKVEDLADCIMGDLM